MGAIKSKFSDSSARSADADWIGVGVENPSSFNDVASDGNKIGSLCDDDEDDVDDELIISVVSRPCSTVEYNRVAHFLGDDWLIDDDKDGANAVTRRLLLPMLFEFKTATTVKHDNDNILDDSIMILLSLYVYDVWYETISWCEVFSRWFGDGDLMI